MRALVYTGTMQSEILDMPLADIQEGQVCIDVHQCGICGSDMHAWHGLDERRIPPLILGHEAVGTAQTGRFAGKRVVLNPLMSCGNCLTCNAGMEHLCASRELLGMRLSGAFAQQVIINESNLTAISDNLQDSDAALAEPLACAVNAVQLAINHIADTTAIVHVLGGGAIGLLAAMVFSKKGFTEIHIAETNGLRRNMLSKIGDFIAYDPREGIPDLGHIDIVLDAVDPALLEQQLVLWCVQAESYPILAFRIMSRVWIHGASPCSKLYLLAHIATASWILPRRFTCLKKVK